MSCEPRWEGPFEAYAKKFVKANHWRVRDTLDEPQDALQECVVVFLRCVRLYGPKVNSPAHLMALYKRMLHNAFIDFSRTGRRRRKVLDTLRQEQRHAALGEDPAAPVIIALGQASTELRQVLQTIGTAPDGVLRRLLRVSPEHPQARTDLSRSWCQLAGTAQVRVDLVDELQALLGR